MYRKHLNSNLLITSQVLYQTITLELMLVILILAFIFVATRFIPTLGLELMLVILILAFIFLPTPLMDFFTALVTTLFDLPIFTDPFSDVSFIFSFKIDDIFSIFRLICDPM